jgi:molybdopterin molybdotransferase
MLVNALEFLIPAIRKLSGRKEPENRYFSAISSEPLKSKKGRVDFIRVNLYVEEGVLKVKSAGSQQTSNLQTMVTCSALAVVEEDRGTVLPGEVVCVLIFHF